MLKPLKLPDSLLKYGVAAAILTVLLYPKFPLIKLQGISVFIRLEDFVILAVFIIWFIKSFNLREFLEKIARPTKIKEAKCKTCFYLDSFTKAILLFFAFGLVSLFFGVFLASTVEAKTAMLHWARRIEYISMLFIGVSAVKTKKDLYFFWKIIILAVIVAFLYGLGQRYGRIPIITTQNEEYSRGIALFWREGSHLVSTFAGHYDLASFLILVFPALYLFLFSRKDTLKKFIPDTSIFVTRATIFIVVLMSLWLLTQTASRISLVSYLGSSVLALIIAGKKKFIPFILVLSFVFASTSMNLVDRYLNFFDVYASELPEELPTPTPLAIIEDRSTSIRLNVEWPRAIRAFTKNPLTGTGYSSITLATDNDYLRMLGEVGLLGFVSFWVAFGFVILILLRNLKKPESPESLYIVGVFSAIPGMLLNMVFIDLLEASKFAIIFWLMIGFAVGIANLYEKAR